MILHDFELSPDCYKLRLFLSILGQRYEVVPVDVFPGREHESEGFRRLSPNGTVPVLDINGRLWTDPEATLVHLAQFYGAIAWLEALERDDRVARQADGRLEMSRAREGAV